VAKSRRTARRSHRTLATLLVLILLSVTIISLDESGRTHRLTSGVKSVATDVFSPLRAGVDDIIRPIGDFFAGAVNYGGLQRENQILRNELSTRRLSRGETAADQRELAQLEKLDRIDRLTSLRTVPTVTAQTIVDNASDFTATITIDKGRAQGVAVTDPVVGGGGLVGKVVQASHQTAIVQLVTDGASEVGVTFGTPVQYAVVDGAGPGNLLQGDFISPSTPITVGEKVYTNGLQGAEFPKGIPVASVVSVRTVRGDADKVVRLRPTADLATLAYVQVLQWSPAP